MTWDEDDQIFWPKKPYASWVKDTTTANGNHRLVMLLHLLQNKITKRS